MPYFLNVRKPLNLFEESSSDYFYVDKTLMIPKLLDLVTKFHRKCICVTRPRRFGKSMMAESIGAFFTKGIDSSGVFSKLKISETEAYSRINSRNVFYIDMTKVLSGTLSCDDLLIKLSSGIIADISEAFPDAKVVSYGHRPSAANRAGERLQPSPEAAMLMDKAIAALAAPSEKFVFVVDEWNSPFDKQYMNEDYKLIYLDFLKDLFKGQDFVYFAYFTGVLPIPRYSNTSSLNNFKEFILGKDETFSDYFGFTQDEVTELFTRYQKLCAEIGKAPKVSMKALKRWYNGYKTPSGTYIYNPLSVTTALLDNNLEDYWASTGKTTQVLDYLQYNFSGVLGDVTSLIKDESIVFEKADTTLEKLVFRLTAPKSRDEVLSMLVAVGLLTYSRKKVSIPNEEIRQEFFYAIRDEKGFGELHNIIVRSEDILKATLSKDANAVAKLLGEVHDKESPILQYNNEAELTHVICMAYLKAVDSYDIERQKHAGTGFADVLFTPVDPTAPAFVVELKVDASAKVALAQIKARKYHKAFSALRFTGPVLLVAIAYNRETKIHSCQIEEVYRPF